MVQSRPFRGNSRTVVESIFPLMVDEANSTFGGAVLTSTRSLICPTRMERFSTGVAPTVSVIPFCTIVANPFAVTVISYPPGKRFGAV